MFWVGRVTLIFALLTFATVEEAGFATLTLKPSRAHQAAGLTLPPLAEPPTASVEMRLRALSMNIYGVPLPGNERGKRAKLLSQRLAAYDLVALQEVFTPETRRWLLRTSFPYKQVGETGTLPWQRLGNGLVVLSRYPIRRVAQLQYQACEGTDCLARKGVVFVRLELPGGARLDVYATHLQAGRSTQAAQVRARQLEGLLAFVERRDQGHPTMLLGDFNALPTSSLYARVAKRAGFADAWHSRGRQHHARAPTGATLATQNTLSPHQSWGGRIDYIFYRSGAYHRLEVLDSRIAFGEPVAGRHLSDHYGVAAQLRLLSLGRHAAGYSSPAHQRL